MSSQKNIVLVYPGVGISGTYVRHLPLSLLYTAIDSIKLGFKIELVDIRLNPDSWVRDVEAKITSNTVLVGISVMSGAPIGNALQISRKLKQSYPHMPIVWGGPHVTFSGPEILDEPTIDYAISGYGSRPLARLAKHLVDFPESASLNEISGLTYRDRKTGLAISVPREDCHEIVDYRDIPYHLISVDLHRYGQFDNQERIFSMYSAIGCPYRCAFCSSPAQYRNIKNPYVPLQPVDVVNHIEYVHETYGATYIYFIDDDSFVNLRHVEGIIDEIKRRKIHVRLGFRGARINEVMNMDDAYLAKLASVGTTILHIGAESGSQRMLDLMNKDCTVSEILEVNRKLARHETITAAYNWVIGLPGETLEDLQDTRALILQLLAENRSAIVFVPNKYRPLPGTELYEKAIQYGYQPPGKLEEWAEIENEGSYRPVWYSDSFSRMVNMMQITSYAIDGKLSKVKMGNALKYRTMKLIACLYEPFARIRFRYGITACLLEYNVFNYLQEKLIR